MAPNVFAAPISELHESVSTMLDNLAFIEKEVTSLELMDDLRNEIVAVCQRFGWTLYDVRKEVYILVDKLGMRPDEEPFDPNVVNPDPRATMGLIECWIAEEAQAMHTLVTKLWALAEKNESLGIVNVLVTESAANVLNAQVRLKEALSSISAQLR